VPGQRRVKLGAFGLDQWLDFEVGGFGADHRERAMLVPAAQRRATGKYGLDPVRDVTVLVGDTPVDVHAGLGDGARVIAVATGLFGVDELAAAGADVVLADLVDVDAFVAAVQRVGELGATGARPIPGGQPPRVSGRWGAVFRAWAVG
jgi:phosphoglycolate phosphatase